MKTDSSVELEDVVDAVHRLTEWVEQLAHAVEDLMVELEWRNNNASEVDRSPTRFVLTSMPVDPATQNWEINRVQASDVAGRSGAV